MQEQFKMGQWVWCWSGRFWGRVIGISGNEPNIIRLDSEMDGGWFNVNNCTANPVIPERPKRTVTKEGWVRIGAIHSNEAEVSDCTFCRNAGRPVKVTYQAEE